MLMCRSSVSAVKGVAENNFLAPAQLDLGAHLRQQFDCAGGD